MKHTAQRYIQEWVNKTGRAPSAVYVPEAIRWTTYCGHPASGARLQHTGDESLWQVVVGDRVTFGPTGSERAANAAYDRACYAVIREGDRVTVKGAPGYADFPARLLETHPAIDDRGRLAVVLDDDGDGLIVPFRNLTKG